MTPANPKSAKPVVETQLKPNQETIFSGKTPFELNHQNALQAINQLKDPNKDPIILPPFFQLPREKCKQILSAYFQDNSEVSNFLELPLPLPAPNQLDNPNVLNQWELALNNFLTTKKEQENLAKAIVPTQAQLLRWQAELKEWEEDYQTAKTKGVVLPDQLSLKAQIERLQKAHGQIEQLTLTQLDNYWSLEERQEIGAKVSQTLSRELINQKEPVTETTINRSINQLCREDSQLAAALSKTKRVGLAHQLAIIATPEKLQQLAQTQEKITQAKIVLAPSRNQLIDQVQQLGFSQKEAAKIVSRMEIFWPTSPRPTKLEVKQAIKRSLSLQNSLTISRNGLTEAEITDSLVPGLNSYYLAAPLAQPEGKNFPISKPAQRWAKKLNHEPIAMENLLRGMTVYRIGQEITLLTALKETGKVQKLQELLEKVKNIDIDKLPLYLRWQIKQAEIKLKWLAGFEKINPFGMAFYRHHSPATYTKLQALKKQWNYVTKDSVLGIVFSPFYKIRQWDNRFYQWRWNTWGKFVSKLTKKEGLQKFLYYLPAPSHWLRPGYWLRKGTGKLTMWVGQKLGQKLAGVLLRKAGAIIINEGFKALFKAGLGALLKTLLGSAAGPVGTAIGILLSAVSVLKFIFSPEGQELIKKVLEFGAKLAGGAIIFLFGLFSQFPLTFIFLGIGAFFGPGGAVLGAGIGFAFDNAISAIGGWAGLGQGASAAASGLAGGAASAASVSPALTTLTAVGIGGAITAVAAGSYISHAARSSAFVVHQPPEGYEESEEAKSFTVTKTAQPQIPVGSNTEITYTITLSSKTDKLTNIQINDQIDQNNIDILNIEGGGNFNSAAGTITWNPNDLEGLGTTLTITYRAKTKPSFAPQTKATNTVTVLAKLADGTELTRNASVTLNSSGSEIADRAKAIIQNLLPGFWAFYNLSPDYPELFNQNEYSCCPNHCYRSNSYPSGCAGNYLAIANGEAMFWCSWLVVKAYNETGHSMPPVLAVGSMKAWFESQGKFLPGGTDVSQLEEGMAIMFTAPSIESPGGTYWAHVGIICDLGNRNDYITVCESNNYATLINYTVSGGRVQGQGRLSIGGFGKP